MNRSQPVFVPVRSERWRRERRGARVLGADAAAPARERERAGGHEARERERRGPRSRCAPSAHTQSYNHYS